MTGALEVVAVVALGALGTLLRAEVAWWSSRRTGSARTGTWLVNLLGASVLGAVVSLQAAGHVGDATARVLGMGLLGGLTTFSTWMVLVLHPTASPRAGGGRGRDVAVHGLGMLAAGVVAAAVGVGLAALLP